ARSFGKPAIVLKVVKRTGKNIIDTIAKVKDRVEAVSQKWPSEVRITISQDQSSNIRDMLASLQNNVLSAILLVMLIIILALGLRSGLLVSIAIPGSFLTGILVLYLLGITVNIVVLFSLILSIGILVDGAIVVSEYADRQLQLNHAPDQAYSIAARHMSWPIIASISTTLAAFLPLMFWPGLVGEFMKFLPLTLIAVLIASLFMALLFLPVLGTTILRLEKGLLEFFKHASPKFESAFKKFCKPLINQVLQRLNINLKWIPAFSVNQRSRLKESNLINADDAPKNTYQNHKETVIPLPLSGISGGYIKILRVVLKWPLVVILSAIGLLLLLMASYHQYGKGVEFFPKVDPSQMSLHIAARGNLSLKEKSDIVAQAEQKILELHQKNNEFLSITSLIGKAGSGDDRANDVIGVINMELVNWRQRRPTEPIIHEVRQAVKEIAGARFELRYQRAGPPRGKPIHLEISSGTPRQQQHMIYRIRSFLENHEKIVDIEDSLPLPSIEWRIDIDRAEAGKFGITVEDVGHFVRLLTKGLKFSDFRPDDNPDEVDIVMLAPQRLRSLNELQSMRIMTPHGPIPLSNFASLQAVPQTGTLRRIDAQPIQYIKADIAPDILPEKALDDVLSWLKTQNVP
ncbi:MAG: efflux RND transporter permease subunit, partial [Pseudomonadota bacterium]